MNRRGFFSAIVAAVFCQGKEEIPVVGYRPLTSRELARQIAEMAKACPQRGEWKDIEIVIDRACYRSAYMGPRLRKG